MCRLYGVYSSRPVAVHRAFAALRSQSHEHQDGWGVARFDAAAPELVLGLEPAYGSARFLELAALQSRSLLAHIRQASVGPMSPNNAHPFVAEGWAFTHNGTVRRWDKHREAFDAQIPAARRALIRGDTDSERCFQLFLHHLEGPSLRQVAVALTKVMRAVEQTFDQEPGERSSTNFLVSNGTVMAALRRGKTLFTAEIDGARMIASEPLWHDQVWQEIAENTVVGVDQALRLERFDCSQL